jgi:hypothetical protein
MTLRMLADDNPCLAMRASERELTGAPVWMKVRITSSRILRSRPDGSVLCLSRLIDLLHTYTFGSRPRLYRENSLWLDAATCARVL